MEDRETAAATERRERPWTGTSGPDSKGGGEGSQTRVDGWRRLVRVYDRIDRRITETLAAMGIPALRISLGIVFLWFGVLKFFPGLSPAEDLAAETIERLSLGIVRPEVAVLVLAVWESAIGLGLLTGLFMRATLLLLVVQMAGTITPLFLFPEQTFTVFPIAPTLEGQYIIKNIVLVAAAIVVGATVRGGGLSPAPDRTPRPDPMPRLDS